MPQCASALGAAGGCTLRIKGTIAVARMKHANHQKIIQ
ncbi:hypothetical protein ABH909_004555 [Pseudomonas sp. BS3782 TE3695]|jgi:hypothetical protein